MKVSGYDIPDELVKSIETLILDGITTAGMVLPEIEDLIRSKLEASAVMPRIYRYDVPGRMANRLLQKIRKAGLIKSTRKDGSNLWVKA